MLVKENKSFQLIKNKTQKINYSCALTFFLTFAYFLLYILCLFDCSEDMKI